MFDTYEIGKRILELRIRSGLTQSQLADKLYVSYQAISNWERGHSLPDIGKLKSLSEVLNCSIDDIIGDNKEKKLINAILNDEYAQIDFDNISLDNLCNVIPFIENENIEVLLKKLDPSAFTFMNAISVAPFICEELINYILDHCQGQSITICELLELAPFIEEHRLNDLVKNSHTDNIDDINLITSLAPFVSKESLDILLKRLNKDTLIDFMSVLSLAPFVNQNTLYELALKVNSSDDVREIMYLAPFLSHEQLNVLLKNHLK